MNKKNFIDFAFGLGMAGGKLSKSFSQIREINYRNINFSNTDINFADSKNTLVLDGKGTGRDLQKGKELTVQYKNDIIEYVKKYSNNYSNIGIFCGIGGGSGSSMLYTVISTLLEDKKKVILFASLPDKKEGLPENSNYLISLQEIIGKYLQSNLSSRITIILIENDYCLNRYPSENNGYYENVNKNFVEGAHLIYNNIYKNNYGIEDRAFVIDENEFNKIIYNSSLLSFNQYKFSSNDVLQEIQDLKAKDIQSIFSKNLYSLNTSKNVLIEINLPFFYRNNRNTNTIIDKIIDKIKRISRIENNLVGVNFSASFKNPEINLIFQGISFNGTLMNKIKNISAKIEKVRNRGSVSKMDLTGMLKF